eukprot:TRINITY_DN35812_c0_g1_i1.p1 TRINITY_DN35812_c0_g1~~TRINITY_DN35812_c0_g1_i1.p1  ORF type:complete len:503 (+),score=88.21 TRINITY_DN35812_c0_g1_i1:230-1738(+)
MTSCCPKPTSDTEFGGSFPWVDVPFKLKVHGGLSPIRWLPRLGNLLLLRRLIFAADGSVRRPASARPLSLAGRELRWRWDASHSRIIIHFFQNGALVLWRWEELCPEDLRAFQSWMGTAHYGRKSFPFQLFREQEACCHSPSSGSESLFVEPGSFGDEEEDIPAVDTLTCRTPKNSGQSLRHLAQRIDEMWLQEIVIQSSAEVLHFLLEAADAILHEGVAAGGVRERCRGHVQEVRRWAQESIEIRMHARGHVALEGGFSELQRSFDIQLDESLKGILPFLDLLQTNGGEVKSAAMRMRSNLEIELQSLNELKELNSEVYMMLGQSSCELAQHEWAVTRSIIEAAGANPENRGLQQAAIKAILRTHAAFRDHCVLPDDNSSRNVLLSGVKLVLGAATSPDMLSSMAVHALAVLAQECEDDAQGLLDEKAANVVLQAMARRPSDTPLQADAILFLHRLARHVRLALGDSDFETLRHALQTHRLENSIRHCAEQLLQSQIASHE